eukprot:1154799-Pelagomonas_calceolata.AAC.3
MPTRTHAYTAHANAHPCLHSTCQRAPMLTQHMPMRTHAYTMCSALPAHAACCHVHMGPTAAILRLNHARVAADGGHPHRGEHCLSAMSGGPTC